MGLVGRMGAVRRGTVLPPDSGIEPLPVQGYRGFTGGHAR